MKNFKFIFQSLKRSCSLLPRLSPQYSKYIIVQCLVFGALTAYSSVISPWIISNIYGALNDSSVNALLRTSVISFIGLLIIFALSYLNNVFLDWNNFRIIQEAHVNSFLKLYKEKYDILLERYLPADIHNRVTAGCSNISHSIYTLVLLVSYLTAMAILLFMAGGLSFILILFALFVTVIALSLASIEGKVRSKYEGVLQNQEGIIENTLYMATQKIEFLAQYNVCDAVYLNYRREREELWKSKWRQEKISIICGSFLEWLTVSLRGVIGVVLFFYKDELSNDRIASSFSIFDNLRSVAIKLTREVSGLIKSLTTTSRLYDVLYVSQNHQMDSDSIQDDQNNCDVGIELKNSTYVIDGKTILNNINLKIRKNEKVAIIGYNGSGKSTLLKLITGVVKPNHGTVTVNGRNPYEISNATRHDMFSFIPSDLQLYDLTIHDNIDTNLKETNEDGIASALSISLLDEELIENQTQIFCSNLSGGQKQRVNIARGFVNATPIMLADEPTSGVPAAQENLLMKNLIEQSNTLLVVTHNPSHLCMFNRILFLENGNIIFDGNSNELRNTVSFENWMGEANES